MNLVTSIIDIYFNIIGAINIRSISIIIIAIIIGIEFLEFFMEKDGGEEKNAKEKARKQRDMERFKKLVGLESNRKSVRGILSKIGPEERQPGESPSTAKGYLSGYDEALQPGNDRAQVIGSRTYTVRAVLEGNYIYLEEVEEKASF